MADETPKKRLTGRRPARDFYAAVKAAMEAEMALGNLYPNCVKAVAKAAGVMPQTVIRAAERGYPAVNGHHPPGGPFPPILNVLEQPNPINPQALQPIQYAPPAESIDPARDTMRNGFRAAFLSGSKHNLVNYILDAAIDRTHPNQGVCLKMAAAYAFGTPQKSLDDSTVKRLAQQMAEELMTQALEEAKKRRTIDVNNTPSPAVE